LARDVAINGFAPHSENAANSNRVEPAVVDQPADRLRMHAELCRNVADADQTVCLSF
jgi:hypothetical protein